MRSQDFAPPEEMSRDALEAEVRESRQALAELDELRQELQSMKGEMARMNALQAQLDTIKQVFAGDVTEFSTWDPEKMTPIGERLQSLEETAATHGEKFEMFVVEEGKKAKPDERAIHLRQVLHNNAKSNDGKARIDRSAASAALGGDLHRGSVLDAMKRAADGTDSDINGSSDLQPIQGVEFHAGTHRDTQSTVALDLTQFDPADLRKNLTTKAAEEEGSR